MQRALITKAGQLSLPAAIRKRWNARAVLIDDRGDHVVVRPVPDDPISRFRGRFAGRGPSSEAARRLAREEEARIEEAKARRLLGKRERP
jgi:bifunctional DNA-binding transcriptional regulator/antitoxin component of YhaV-PrlF toxin-antitoxin module